MGTFRPEIQPLTPLYTFFFLQKQYPFRIPFTDEWYSFHMPSLQFHIRFNPYALSLKYE